jgi:glutamate-ammonia-ligase adenylyltransferase
MREGVSSSNLCAAAGLFRGIPSAEALPWGLSEALGEVALPAADEGLDDQGFAARLAQARAGVLRALMARELRDPDIWRTLREYSAWVERALGVAFARAREEVEQRHGLPLTEGAEGPSRCRAAVVGLGALAGGELEPRGRASLLFVYESDEGRSEGGRGLGQSVDLHAFHTRLFATFAGLLDGTRGPKVLDLDLEWRPEGGAGALCNSVEALERYYERLGQSYDRLALAQARPLCGDRELGVELLEVLRPFVFPRRLDDQLGRDLASLRRRLVTSPREGAVGSMRDLALVTAALQSLHGGRKPSLRGLGTGSALAELEALGLAPGLGPVGDARALLARVGVCLDFRDISGGAPNVIALSPPEAAIVLGACEEADPVSRLSAAVDRAIALLVASSVELLPAFGAEDAAAPPAFGDALSALNVNLARELRLEALSRLGLCDARLALARLDSMSRHPESPFHPARVGPSSLAKKVLDALAGVADPDAALAHVEALVRHLRARPSVLAQLEADPKRLSLLLRAFGASHFLARGLLQIPGLLDRVVLEGREPISRGRAELERMLAGELGPAPSLEVALGVARRFHRAELVRIGFHYLAGHIDAPELQLSALAEALIATLARAACGQLGVDPVALVVVAHGALGAGEQTFDSDLHLELLVDDAIPHDLALRFGRALVEALASATRDGPLYALRAMAGPSPLRRWLEAGPDLLGARVIMGRAAASEAIEVLRRASRAVGPAGEGRWEALVAAVRVAQQGGEPSAGEASDALHPLLAVAVPALASRGALPAGLPDEVAVLRRLRQRLSLAALGRSDGPSLDATLRRIAEVRADMNRDTAQSLGRQLACSGAELAAIVADCAY